MIIELYGLPGCGKSFLLSSLTGKMDASHSTKNPCREMLMKLLKKAVVFTPGAMKLKKKIYVVLGTEKKSPIYFYRPLSVYIDNLCMIATSYRRLKRKDLYMDEGYIQRIVAMAVNYGISIEDTFHIIDIIRKVIPYTYTFYLYYDAEACFQSIKGRNRHEVEMDELDDEMLMKFLKQYEVYFRLISKKYHYPKITREEYSSLEEIIIQ